MFELTGFQRDLLYTVAGLDKPSGQRVLDEINDDIGTVNHGRLYPNLDDLVEEGYVKRGQQDRRTNYYEMTETGERVLRRRRKWENQKVPFFE
jgi:DNA-binding PadR family transcriptional regulator